MATDAPTTGTVNAATFDVTAWLSRFESVGGSYLATDSQTCFCIPYEGITQSRQGAAHALLRELTDDQRADVVSHIRAQSGFLPIPQETARQPDLKAIPLENIGEPAGNAQPSGGPSLDHKPEGSDNMDMTHAFKPEAVVQRLMDWDSALTVVPGAHFAELDAIDARSCELSAKGGTEADWAAWDAWTMRVYDEIEALAPTPDNMKLKARAVWSIMDGDIDELGEGNATSYRLVRQIVSCLGNPRTGQPIEPNEDLKRTRNADWDAAMKAFQAAEAAEMLYDKGRGARPMTSKRRG